MQNLSRSVFAIEAHLLTLTIVEVREVVISIRPAMRFSDRGEEFRHRGANARDKLLPMGIRAVRCHVHLHVLTKR